MSILSILNELAADASGNAKKAILEREKNNVLLKKVFEATYNPYTTYGIKKIPAYMFSHDKGLDWAIDQLSLLATREVTGHAGINHLKDLLERCTPDDAEVLARIIQRDLRCAVTSTTANKIWPGLVPTFDVLLCHKDISCIKYPAFAQMKGDGLRCHLHFDGVNCQAFSRSGKVIDTKGTFDKVARVMMKAGETWDGELLVKRDGKILDRKTGNGIANKAIKDTIEQDEADLFVFLTWDIVDFSSTIAYDKRLAEMNGRFTMVGGSTDKIMPCPTVVAQNEAEAKVFYQKMRAEGAEGAVLKNFNLLWEPKRVKGAGKMKAEEEADLIIVGMEEGTGKYKGMLGSFIMETSDGKLQVGVGSGFDDSERAAFFNKKMIGRVATVRYNEKIKDKSSTKWSLFLPRWVELREDKDVANSFDELV